MQASTQETCVRNSVLHTALAALACGISVIPICCNGSKAPALDLWREYYQRCASQMEIESWFRHSRSGIAFVTGAVSGYLEALDFDDDRTFQAWLSRVRQDKELADLYQHVSWGYLEVSPSGGRHLLYRCKEGIEGNKKLACRPPRDGNPRQTLIETRGERGLIIVAPSSGGVHPSGKPYKISLGGVSSIRTITSKQRALLLDSARAFDEMPVQPKRSFSSTKVSSVFSSNQDRPGDRFNAVASWEEVLCPHGWEFVRTVGEESYWRRPGKRGPGISATTNYQGTGLLYVFSTSTEFEPEQPYSLFAAYTLLNHNGDFTAAARALAESGYGSALENRRIG